MRQSIFGKTGLSVSALGFGGGPIGYLETDQQRATTILNLLLDRGVNLIDTAAAYVGSEEVIGKAVAHRRQQFVLISKCGRSVEGVQGESWSATYILQTIDRALKRLRTDHLDAMLLHSCNLEVLKQGEAVGALVDARKAGKIRFAGYSGDNEAAAYAAAHPEIAVIETSVNICDQANLETVLPIATKNNVGVLAKRPIANSAWKPAEQQQGIYRSYVEPYVERFQQMGLSPTTLGFSGDPAKVWPEIALRFTLSQHGVHSAIVGTTNPANAEANLKTVEAGQLPADVASRIRQAFRTAEQRSGTPWKGLT